MKFHQIACIFWPNKTYLCKTNSIMKILKFLFLALLPTIANAQIPKTNIAKPQKIESTFLNDTTFEKDLNDPQSINIIVRNPKGMVVSQGRMKSNKKEGVWREYSSTGLITVLEEYKNGFKNGSSLKFGPGNQISIDATYKNDSLNGQKITYGNNGKIKSIEFYNNGLLNGDRKAFYDDGKIQEECTYKNGKKDGNAIWYLQNGQTSVQYNYTDGVLNGYAKEYSPKGVIIREGNFKNDNEEGEWTLYEDSNVTKKVIYKNGEIIKTSILPPAKIK